VWNTLNQLAKIFFTLIHALDGQFVSIRLMGEFVLETLVGIGELTLIMAASALVLFVGWTIKQTFFGKK
jgi:hypothetical protein